MSDDTYESVARRAGIPATPSCPLGRCDLLDDSRERHEAQIEQLRQGVETLRMEMADEKAERAAADNRISYAAHRRMTAIEVRLKDCEAVVKPWRSLLINVGTAAALAVAAYARAKGWI